MKHCDIGVHSFRLRDSGIYSFNTYKNRVHRMDQLPQKEVLNGTRVLMSKYKKKDCESFQFKVNKEEEE
jgi:hypothetical protein